MPDWFWKGGIAMWPLLVCSIAAVSIMIERAWALRRRRVLSPALVSELLATPTDKDGSVQRLKQLCANDRTVLGVLVQTVFNHASLSKQENVEAVQAVARQYVGKMERGLTTLGVVAELGPLLGLLGTVSGMVQLFADVSTHGLSDPALISKGISEALVATFTGLSVAIPAVVAYLFLRRRIEMLALEMERHVNELLGRIYR